ncbi:S-adenosyl-L-methionine-dependent methyltransferase [Xylariaceae sp. FL1651]|nr:S-adenosyl-L-methionine-dependent methyltransferase [Xylariaceae sp. FL1651]
MPADFEKQSYWRDRFASETSFEWLTSSATFMSIIEPYLSSSQSQRILHLGSGTSDLHTYFRARGYLDVTNIDYEPLALDRGRQLEERAFGDVQMKYAVADVTKLHVNLPESNLYDLVVDKSTVDAVSCGGSTAFANMIMSVRKFLAVEGLWISLSYSANRFDVEGLPFSVRVIAKIPTPKAKATDPDVYYWCYLLRP